jgi:hypothetical protein
VGKAILTTLHVCIHLFMCVCVCDATLYKCWDCKTQTEVLKEFSHITLVHKLYLANHLTKCLEVLILMYSFKYSLCIYLKISGFLFALD